MAGSGQIYIRGFAPRKHPAPGLQPGLHRKTAFCFSVNNLYSGLAGQQSHASHLSLQSKSQPSGSQYPSVFRQSLQAKQQTNPQKQSQKTTKKEAEASLEKITAETCRLLPHNVQQLRSSCWYIPHIKTRPAVYTFWQNISFHQKVQRICRHRFLP